MNDSLLDRLAPRYARIALAAAFLSAVAGRFGVWSGQPGMHRWANFVSRVGDLNPFLPRAVIPVVAWAVTALEVGLAVALLLGVWPRRVALAAAALLAVFGLTMALFDGPQSPLDYSVFSASAAALLLARASEPNHETKSSATLRGL